jgi:hypothetical protein
MKRLPFVPALLVLITLCSAFALGAVPTRGSSKNGVDSGAPFWNVFGPTSSETMAYGIYLRRQIICPNQDFANAVDASNIQQLIDSGGDPSTVNVSDSGTCQSGAYMFLFQIRSSNKNLQATITNLVGFTPDTTEGFGTYGVETCEDFNTLELCSNVAAASTTNLAKLAKVSATINSAHTRIVFCIPAVPSFPAGTPQQGQGLTLVVVTQQTPGTPPALPRISF